MTCNNEPQAGHKPWPPGQKTKACSRKTILLILSLTKLTPLLLTPSLSPTLPAQGVLCLVILSHALEASLSVLEVLLPFLAVLEKLWSSSATPFLQFSVR